MEIKLSSSLEKKCNARCGDFLRHCRFYTNFTSCFIPTSGHMIARVVFSMSVEHQQTYRCPSMLNAEMPDPQYASAIATGLNSTDHGFHWRSPLGEHHSMFANKRITSAGGLSALRGSFGNAEWIFIAHKTAIGSGLYRALPLIFLFNICKHIFGFFSNNTFFISLNVYKQLDCLIGHESLRTEPLELTHQLQNNITHNNLRFYCFLLY